MNTKKIDERSQIEILVAEDSPTQAEQLKFILEQRGFKVSVVGSGKEAIEFLTKRKPAIVITDVLMPEMSGFDLCRSIRSHQDLKETPVILLTSLSDPTDVIKGLEAGANNFITKPYDEKSLTSVIQYLIANMELRRNSVEELEEPGLKIFYAGENHYITADRSQILDLLLSTYENAYLQNRQLIKTQIEMADLNQRLEDTVLELSVENIERRRMEEALSKSHDELELRILQRTSELSMLNQQYVVEIEERKHYEHTLNKLYERSRMLAAHLQSVREEERTRIAREVHDELGQILTALKMDLNWLKNNLSGGIQTLSEKLQYDLEIVDTTIQSVKRICTELRPGVLDHLGVGEAIEWQAGEFQRRTGIKCMVSVEPKDLALDSDRSTAIFRIFQEALTNVRRHSNATEVKVNLMALTGGVVLEVYDNGIGITDEQHSKFDSFGILGMRERVYPWRGEVSISPALCGGTALQVKIPL